MDDDWPTEADLDLPKRRFFNECLGFIPTETDDERLYRLAWAAYHYETERFDLHLPHTISKRSGDAIPLPGYPMQACQRFARFCMCFHLEHTDYLRRRLGLNRVLQIRRSFDRLSHKDIGRMLDEDSDADYFRVSHAGRRTSTIVTFDMVCKAAILDEPKDTT